MKRTVQKGGSIPRTTLQILLALAGGPRHGYGIKLDVEAHTGGAICLGSGTLYEAIQRLTGLGWIDEVPPPDKASGGPPRRVYALTKEGQRVLEDELAAMEAIIRFARDKRLLRQAGN